MVDSIIVVCAKTHCALLHTVCNLKAVHVNMQFKRIQEFILYTFKLGHNGAKVTKSICWAKDEGTADHSTVTSWFKKICSGYKNLNNQLRSGRPKTIDSKAMLQIIDANPTNKTWRVSGEHSISQSSVVCDLHDVGKNIQSYWIVPHVVKILQNLWLLLVL